MDLQALNFNVQAGASCRVSVNLIIVRISHASPLRMKLFLKINPHHFHPLTGNDAVKVDSTISVSNCVDDNTKESKCQAKCMSRLAYHDRHRWRKQVDSSNGAFQIRRRNPVFMHKCCRCSPLLQLGSVLIGQYLPKRFEKFVFVR